MPQFKNRVGTISVASYSAVFNARGLTLAAESRSDGAITVTASRGSTVVAVGEGWTTMEAMNDCAGRVGIPGHPVFTS